MYGERATTFQCADGSDSRATSSPDVHTRTWPTTLPNDPSTRHSAR